MRSNTLRYLERLACRSAASSRGKSVPRVWKKLLPALVAGSTAMLVAAACGSSDGEGGDSASGSNGQQSAMSAYVQCMKKNGVEITMPSGRPGNRPSGDPGDGAPGQRPSGAPWDGAGGDGASGEPRERPSGMPSGRPSGAPGGGRGQMFGKPDGVDDATWLKASEACKSALPTGGPRGQNQGGDQGGDQGGAANAGSGTAYQNCLTDHGVELAELSNTSDKSVAAAVAACKVLSPSPAK